MVRLIDPAIEKLSKTINEMGQDAITCFSLAVDSYLEDRETAPQVHDLSEKIRKNYYSVEAVSYTHLTLPTTPYV